MVQEIKTPSVGWKSCLLECRHNTTKSWHSLLFFLHFQSSILISKEHEIELLPRNHWYFDSYFIINFPFSSCENYSCSCGCFLSTVLLWDFIHLNQTLLKYEKTYTERRHCTWRRQPKNIYWLKTTDWHFLSYKSIVSGPKLAFSRVHNKIIKQEADEVPNTNTHTLDNMNLQYARWKSVLLQQGHNPSLASHSQVLPIVLDSACSQPYLAAFTQESFKRQ